MNEIKKENNLKKQENCFKILVEETYLASSHFWGEQKQTCGSFKKKTKRSGSRYVQTTN